MAIVPSDCLTGCLGVDEDTGLPGIIIDPNGGIECGPNGERLSCPPRVTSLYDPPGTFLDLAAVDAEPCTVRPRSGCTTTGEPYLLVPTPGAFNTQVVGGLTSVGPFTMSNTAAGAGLQYAPTLTVPFTLTCYSRIFVVAEWSSLGTDMSDNTIYPSGPPRIFAEFQVDAGPWIGFGAEQYTRGMTNGTNPWQASQNGLAPFHASPQAVGSHTLQMRLRYEKNEPGTATLLAESKGMYLEARQV